MSQANWAVSFIVLVTVSLVPVLRVRADIADSDSKTVDRTATVYGQKLHYLEAGRGPTVILLHGLGGDANEWRQLMVTLANDYHLIALDQLGSGLSDKPLIAYRPRTLSDVLIGFFGTLNLKHVSVVGNSLGAWVAAWVAISNPPLVDRLVLLDAFGLSSYERELTSDVKTALRQSTKGDLRLLSQLAFYDQSFASEHSIEEAFDARLRAGDGYTVDRLTDSILRGDDTLDRELARVEQPTLIIWGAADRLIAPRFGQEFQRAIVGSRLSVIEQCGHMPHMECPKKLAPLLRAFLGVPISGTLER
jgi:2-hydroxy-6-oxonona-2,4-dienedioate hydrolase